MLKMYFSLGGSDVRFARWGEENPSGIILTFNDNFSNRNDSFLSNHLFHKVVEFDGDIDADDIVMLVTKFRSWWRQIGRVK